MRLIPIEEAEPGMFLAKPIYRVNDGRILLQPKVELSFTLIEKLKKIRCSGIYILDPDELDAQKHSTEPIQEATKMRATIYLKSIVRQVKSNENIEVEKLKIVVKEVIDQLLCDPMVVYNLNQIRSFDKYTFSHSINVSVLSLLVGASMGMEQNELEMIGTGAMLHDIGKFIIKDHILNKPDRLDHIEFELVKRHALEGYNILKTKSNVSFMTAHIAYQHHEREDGSGYPRGLTGKHIHRFAKIVAVADVFDAMTTPRPYRKDIQPHTAIKVITDSKTIKYDPLVVQHFTKVVAPYPIGSLLLLNNGQNVTVTDVARQHCLVKVNEGMQEGKVYNLFQQSNLKVVARIK